MVVGINSAFFFFHLVVQMSRHKRFKEFFGLP